MATSTLQEITWQERLLQEVHLLSEHQAKELYFFTHRLRLEGDKPPQDNVTVLKSLAGAWSDMPDNEFHDFLDDIYKRRQQGMQDYGTLFD